MLAEFIISNRKRLIEHSRERVAARATPMPTEVELANGIPAFLDHLGDALGRARAAGQTDNQELARSAGQHGYELFRMGLTIGQVVHDYGDICQSITSLAIALNAPISGEEFQLLNLCLDDAIAGAVSEWARQRERAIRDQGTERLGILAHELRNALSAGLLAYETLKKGQVAIGGSTGQVLGRSLLGLASLIERSLADVRLDAAIEHVEQISVSGFLEEIEVTASLLAATHDIRLVVSPIAPVVTVEGDRQILAGAIANMLQNAFKFTHPGGTVSLTTRATDHRVLFEVEDECGGLPPGTVEELFAPFSQRSEDRSGLGLGLSICVKAARASSGEMSVRDVPGKGCVFTLNLPRKPPPPLSVVGEGGGQAPARSTRERKRTRPRPPLRDNFGTAAVGWAERLWRK